MAAIRQKMGGTVLVCGFIRPDGMWRLVMVTATSPGGASILVTKKHGGQPEATVFTDTKLCNSTFIRLSHECQTAGYRFYNETTFPIPPLEWDPSTEGGFAGMDKWAKDVSRTAVAFLGNGNELE